MNLHGNKSSDISVLRVKSQSFLVFFLILPSSCFFSSNSSYVSSSIFPLLHSFSFILLLLLLLHSAFPPHSFLLRLLLIMDPSIFYFLLSSSRFPSSPSLPFFHLSLYPIPSFSFSSTYPFSSLIHPASIYFLSLASQYTPLLFSHPPSSLPLFFLLYSLLSIFSVPQSPLLLPTHSFPFFFLFFSMCRLLLLILFFIFLFFSPSSFFHDPPLHFPSILLSSSSYNYPILNFLYFFCTYSSSTLFSPSLSLCSSFPLSHLHPAADFLHITLGLLTYFFIRIYPPK